MALIVRKHAARAVLVFGFVWWFSALVISYHCFSQPKQQSLSALRERTGLALRIKASGSTIHALSTPEKQLLGKISAASEKRKWEEVESLLATYSGNAVPIYTAGMHGAFRCGKYREGSVIFEKCASLCQGLDQPVLTLALRLYGRLGEKAQVRKVWDDALQLCNFTEVLASARIAAAADEGDVETAAAVLDRMNSSEVAIDVHHVNSAMRACWGWGSKRHRAATYLFSLLTKLGLKPTIISFTSLIGAFQTAKLEDILSAYADMKVSQVQPDAVFAETYLACVLQLGKSEAVFQARSPEKLRKLERQTH